ncbi:GntR family transcriptional regulator [Streptomyces syringium]|uniref:GntR family transcriptional regulator n=1 Tax=Streptomyces syringium TaxID=76729 RepID=UPI0033F4800A
MTPTGLCVSTEPAAAAMYERKELRADRRWLASAATHRTAASPAKISGNLQKLQRIAERWLPVARERRAAAAGSAADQARWDTLINAVISAQDISPGSRYEGLVLLAMQLRSLLYDIHDSAPPHVPVVVLAERITEAIEKGTYPAGSRLVPSALAADLKESVPRVKLAIVDLMTAGIVEWRGRHLHVTTPGAERDMPERLAVRIREQIAAGVYLPGTPLPTRPELARTFMVSPVPLSAALRLLADDGLLLLRQASRATVAPAAARAAKVPAAGESVLLAARDRQETRPGTRPIVIREAARTARSWWMSRFIPHPATLAHQLGQLSLTLSVILSGGGQVPRVRQDFDRGIPCWSR